MIKRMIAWLLLAMMLPPYGASLSEGQPVSGTYVAVLTGFPKDAKSIQREALLTAISSLHHEEQGGQLAYYETDGTGIPVNIRQPFQELLKTANNMPMHDNAQQVLNNIQDIVGKMATHAQETNLPLEMWIVLDASYFHALEQEGIATAPYSPFVTVFKEVLKQDSRNRAFFVSIGDQQAAQTRYSYITELRMQLRQEEADPDQAVLIHARDHTELTRQMVLSYPTGVQSAGIPLTVKPPAEGETVSAVDLPPVAGGQRRVIFSKKRIDSVDYQGTHGDFAPIIFPVRNGSSYVILPPTIQDAGVRLLLSPANAAEEMELTQYTLDNDLGMTFSPGEEMVWGDALLFHRGENVLPMAIAPIPGVEETWTATLVREGQASEMQIHQTSDGLHLALSFDALRTDGQLQWRVDSPLRHYVSPLYNYQVINRAPILAEGVAFPAPQLFFHYPEGAIPANAPAEWIIPLADVVVDPDGDEVIFSIQDAHQQWGTASQTEAYHAGLQGSQLIYTPQAGTGTYTLQLQAVDTEMSNAADEHEQPPSGETDQEVSQRQVSSSDPAEQGNNQVEFPGDNSNQAVDVNEGSGGGMAEVTDVLQATIQPTVSTPDPLPEIVLEPLTFFITVNQFDVAESLQNTQELMLPDSIEYSEDGTSTFSYNVNKQASLPFTMPLPPQYHLLQQAYPGVDVDAQFFLDVQYEPSSETADTLPATDTVIQGYVEKDQVSFHLPLPKSAVQQDFTLHLGIRFMEYSLPQGRQALSVRISNQAPELKASSPEIILEADLVDYPWQKRPMTLAEVLQKSELAEKVMDDALQLDQLFSDAETDAKHLTYTVTISDGDAGTMTETLPGQTYAFTIEKTGTYVFTLGARDEELSSEPLTIRVQVASAFQKLLILVGIITVAVMLLAIAAYVLWRITRPAFGQTSLMVTLPVDFSTNRPLALSAYKKKPITLSTVLMALQKPPVPGFQANVTDDIFITPEKGGKIKLTLGKKAAEVIRLNSSKGVVTLDQNHTLTLTNENHRQTITLTYQSGDRQLSGTAFPT